MTRVPALAGKSLKNVAETDPKQGHLSMRTAISLSNSSALPHWVKEIQMPFLFHLNELLTSLQHRVDKNEWHQISNNSD